MNGATGEIASHKFVQMLLDATEASLPTMERVVVPEAAHYVHTDNPAGL